MIAHLVLSFWQIVGIFQGVWDSQRYLFLALDRDRTMPVAPRE
jgi:hypothetical protein